MPKLHITLSDTLHAQLLAQAVKNKRDLYKEAVVILEHAMEQIVIPVVGKVDANGNITLVSYWETPEGIREIIDRG
jgi:hypothetical protein